MNPPPVSYPTLDSVRPATPVSVPISEAPATQRLEWVDVLRLFACMAIVLVHVSGRAYYHYAGATDAEWWLANVMNGPFRASTPLFVMITATLVRERDCDPLYFYRKKAVRFLPIMAAWTLLYGIFDVVVLKMKPSEVGVLFVSSGFVYVHLWYLSMYLFLLAFVPFLGRLKYERRWSRSDKKLFFGLCTVTVFTGWFFAFASEVVGAGYDRWPRYFTIFVPYFLLGLWLSRPEIRPRRKWCALAFAVSVVLAIALNFISCEYLGLVNDAQPLSRNSPMILAIAVSFYLLVKSAPRPGPRVASALAFVRNTTLGIYLIHPLFTWLGRWLTRDAGPDIFAGAWMPLTALAVYLCSMACVLVMKRLPFVRRLC